MAGSSNVKATDSETVASLLDPACDIPFDTHFDIEDEEGTKLGTLGGHKNILALKSPVFKAMLFGPLKETGNHIRTGVEPSPCFPNFLARTTFVLVSYVAIKSHNKYY